MPSPMINQTPKFFQPCKIFRMIAGCLAVALVTVINPACSQTSSTNKAPAVTIDGQALDEKNFSNRARVQLHQGALEYYRNQARVYEEAINDELLEREAKKQGITVEKLKTQEIDNKVPLVTDAEVDNFYNLKQEDIKRYLKQRFQGQQKPTEKELKDGIRGQLSRQRYQERAEFYMKELRGKYKIVINLEAPEAPRIEVDIANNPTKGPANAKVTIVEFSDFECPYCQRAVPVLDQIEKEYGDKVQIVFRDFPLGMHPTARTQAEAGGCAQEQAKFWEFHDQLFAAGVQSKIRQAHGKGGDQGVKKELVSISKTVGIDSKKFQDCIDTKKYASEVDKDFEDGQNYGVQSTPSFFINGRLIAGALPFPEFKKIIDEELAK